jgi:hypothetical protein
MEEAGREEDRESSKQEDDNRDKAAIGTGFVDASISGRDTTAIDD